MNICLLGFGSIGKIYYKLIIKHFKFDKFVIIDKSFILSKRKKNIFFFQSYNDLNFNIKFSHVLIALPSHLHYETAKFFLKKKANVLIEKPFVLKSTDAMQLIKLKKKYKKKCWVMFQNRANKSVQLLKSLLNKNYIGEVKLLRGSLIWSRDFEYYNSDWRGKYSFDGGVLTNQTIHLLDMIYYLFGPINNFNFLALFDKAKLQAEDLILINGLLKTKIPISLSATTRANKDYSVELDIIGSKKRIILNGISLNKLIFFDKLDNKIYGKSHNENFKYGYGNGHQKVLSYFFKSSENDYFDLSIEKNSFIVNFINSVYSEVINKKKKLSKIKKKNSILGS